MLSKRDRSIAIANVRHVRCGLCGRHDLLPRPDGTYPPHWNKRKDERCLNSENPIPGYKSVTQPSSAQA